MTAAATTVGADETGVGTTATAVGIADATTTGATDGADSDARSMLTSDDRVQPGRFLSFSSSSRQTDGTRTLVP